MYTILWREYPAISSWSRYLQNHGRGMHSHSSSHASDCKSSWKLYFVCAIDHDSASRFVQLGSIKLFELEDYVMILVIVSISEYEIHAC